MPTSGEQWNIPGSGRVHLDLSPGRDELGHYQTLPRSVWTDIVFEEKIVTDDDAAFDLLKNHLYVAAVCDILDSLGYRHQAMHHRLRPLLPDIRTCGFVGRARPLQWMETSYIDEDPYGPEIEAVDSLRPGDVIVHSTDHAGTNAPWGELMSTVAKRNGAVGCVCDSQVRDCVRIIDMGFSV